MPDIAPVKGLIELTDNFTSQIGLAEAALSNFSKANQESLKAVAGAAGLVTAAIIAIAAATIELGRHGSEVNDVSESLTTFAGGAQAANAAMNALRTGTKGTVDDFSLAKDAAHLLSTGVQLTAADFATLGQAASIMRERGLGGTKEQLDLISDALVTGRTRTLAHSLGVVDATDAEEKFAAKLGITKDQLNQVGVAEARRQAVMDLLNRSVQNAVEHERSFGEEIDYAKTQLFNWVDQLSASVAKSTVFAAGMHAIEDAVSGAFGDDEAAAIKNITSFLEQGAITLLDFGQNLITAAEVGEKAWLGLKTIILGVATAIVGGAQGIAELAHTSSTIAGVLLGIPPKLAEGIGNMRDNLRAMTKDLAAQTSEAATAAAGHTAFDQTLDTLSTNLGNVRQAMVNAQNATANNTKTVDDAADGQKKLSTAAAATNASFIDQGKVLTVLMKSTQELNDLWADYFATVAKGAGTSRDAQIADINAVVAKQIDALDYLDPLYAAKYDAIQKTAAEKISQIGSAWDSLRDQSVEGLDEQAQAAEDDYEKMITSGLHFNRDVLDAQKQKYLDLVDKIHGVGKSVQDATSTAASAIKVLDSAWISDSDIAAATISKTTVMVRTLSGELITLAEAEKRQQEGGSFDVTSANFSDAIQKYITSGGFNAAGQGVQQYRDPNTLAKLGYSFAEIIRYAFDKNNQGPLPPPQGPRIPGFKEGGTVMVGENGAEVVRLPLGSTVYPTGTTPNMYGGSGGMSINFGDIHVNGTPRDNVKQIKTLLLRELMTLRQLK